MNPRKNKWIRKFNCVFIMFVSLFLIIGTPFMCYAAKIHTDLILVTSLFALCLGWLVFMVANEVYKEL